MPVLIDPGHHLLFYEWDVLVKINGIYRMKEVRRWERNDLDQIDDLAHSTIEMWFLKFGTFEFSGFSFYNGCFVEGAFGRD